MLFFLLPEEYW